MSKVYKYCKDGKEYCYNADDNTQKYLELNEKLTTESPEDFISKCVKVYNSFTVEDAVIKGICANTNSLNMMHKFGNMQLNFNYSQVQDFLDEMTRKSLHPSQEEIERITQEVCGKE